MFKRRGQELVNQIPSTTTTTTQTSVKFRDFVELSSLVWVTLKWQPYLFQGVLSNGANVFSLTGSPKGL